MARIGIGIDLGTTYSLVAVVDHGKPRVLTVDGEGRVPSAVFYGDDIAAGALVGFEATAAAQHKSGALLTSTKRFMGRGRSDAARFLKDGARTYVLHTGGDERHVEFVVPDGASGTRTSSPVEVAAYILKNLKDRAEAELSPNAEIKDAVVTVPAYFDEAQRQATRDAGRLAGLNVLRLVAEPTAAALAYGLDKEASGRGQGTYVVFDLGGGTFDVSVLEFDRGLFRVRATAGDTALGGDDFDWPIAQRVLLAAGLTQEAAQPQQVHQALRMARHAKELLTTKDSVDVEGVLPQMDGTAQPVAFTLTRQELDALILPVVNRCADPCERALRDAGITPEQLHGVILVGGSTRVPLVRAFARTFFGREPLIDAHPDEVVAAGAALQADLLVGGATDALLLDVTPLSLGLETMGGVVDKLIPRNSPIPCSATHTFTTYVDGQTAMDIHVVQGERERVDHNKSLARFRLRGIPPLGAGLARVAVTFQLDADGLLTVTAKEQATGLVQTVEVKPSYGLTDGEVEELLMASFDNAERDMEERMLIEKRVDARRIVQVTESALDEDGDAMLTGPERAAIVAAMEAVHAAMAGTDRHAIAAATDALDAATQEFARRRMSKRISEALEHHNIDAVLDDARTGALR